MKKKVFISTFVFVMTCSTSFVLAGWDYAQSLQIARLFPGVAKDGNGFIYARGGSTAYPWNKTNTVERYDEITGQWNFFDELPVFFGACSATCDNTGRIYVLAVGIFLRYDDLNGWEYMASPDLPDRCSVLTTDLSGYIYALGGDQPGNNYTDTVERYDPLANIWQYIAPMQNRRSGHAAVTDNNGRIYAIGGCIQDGSSFTDTTTVECYNPAQPEVGWQYVSSMSTRRRDLAAVLDSNGKIWAIGGWLPGVTNCVEIYDPDTDTWTTGPSLNQPRNTLGAVLGDSGKIYAIGGCAFPTLLNVVEVYWEPPDDSCWKFQTVDGEPGSGLDSGLWCALAFDKNGDPAIAHQEHNALALRYSWQESSIWYTEVVDSPAGFTGASLAFDNNGYPSISYFKHVVGDLMYAYKDENGWNYETVDSDGNTGIHSSLAFNDGYPAISYQREETRDLLFAWKDSGGWHTTTVDEEGDVGQNTSLAFNNGFAAISYWDKTNSYLKYAWEDESGWHISIVDTFPGPIADMHTSLEFNNNQPAIAYWDSVDSFNGKLKYARYDQNSWHLITIESGLSGAGWASLAFNLEFPVISYGCSQNGIEKIKLATMEEGSTWEISTVYEGGGYWNSLAFNGSSPSIAFYDNIIPWAEGSLKIAQLSYVDSTLTYIGDMLIPIDESGTSTATMAAVLLDENGDPHVNIPVNFTVINSNGTDIGQCSNNTDEQGIASCDVSGLLPDVYTVTTVSDLYGCITLTDEALLVVYDPDVPRATGGGFILPDAESTLPAQSGIDKANFGFIVRIDKNQAAARNLEFQYKAAGINLKSQNMTWYTVSNNKAMFQGEATINGEGLYTFRVHATDGDLTGDQPDAFDIKIWEDTDTESEPIHRSKNDLAGGSIVVHKK